MSTAGQRAAPRAAAATLDATTERAIALGRSSYRRFIGSLTDSGGEFRLAERAEPTPYARCFGIFGLHLLKDAPALAAGADAWAHAIRRDLDAVREARRAASANIAFDKPYLQLLAFSLSALSILDRLGDDALFDHVAPLVEVDVAEYFERAGVLRGKPGSGNLALFLAVALLHARDALGLDTAGAVDAWQSLHLGAMNRFGFWGPGSSMSHLQFQNGYHQYEIFEYLDTPVPGWPAAANHVASLADGDGHFSPYVGGSGCYDYDAVFMITGAGQSTTDRHAPLLRRTAASILAEQNADGGFCESHCVRPRSIQNTLRMLRHVRAARGYARLERLRLGLALLLARHDRIHTHWSRYSREWGESNLWDSWFRMLTLARIQTAFEPDRAAEWGFIGFPGIGYHASQRRIASR